MPPLIVQAYVLLLFLGGLACFIHFCFFLKGSKKIDPDRAVPEWRLGVLDFLIGAGAIVFAVVAVQVVVASAAPAEWLIRDTPELVILFGFSMHVTALGVLLIFYKAEPDKFQEPLASRNLGWARSFAIALYAFLVVLPVLYPLTYAWQFILETIGVDPRPQETVLIFAQVDRLPLVILMIVLIVILAPLSEEILFRGCLYRFLKARVSIVFALVSSGILFALLHQNLLSFLPLFLLGTVLAYAYEKSGSLKVPILIHGIFNLNTVVIIVLLPETA